jgi:hypothetical protein
MEASDWQKNNRIFTGARFDVMTVRRWRDNALASRCAAGCPTCGRR